MKFSAGCDVLNILLRGGYEADSINVIYGPAASGKTTCCFLASIDMVKKGGKVLFIDSENGFSVERIKQLAGDDYKKIVENIFVLRVGSFEEQKNKFQNLFEVMKSGGFSLLVVDTIGAYYRRALKSDVYGVNKAVDAQFRILKEIAENTKCGVLVTNQVYADFKEKDKVEMVGGKMFRNWSKVLIELQNLSKGNRKAILVKPNLNEICFDIREKGFFILQ